MYFQNNVIITKNVVILKIQNTEPANTKKATNYSNNNVLNSFLSELHPEETRPFTEIPRTLFAVYVQEFIMSLRMTNGKHYNASSLRTIVQALSGYLYQEFNISMKTDPELQSLNTILKRKMEESVRKGKPPGIKASRPIEKSVLTKAINEGLFSVSTPRGLLALLILKLQTGFGLRGGKELYDIRVSDIIFRENREDGVPHSMELVQRVTKTRRELNLRFDQNSRPRIFPDDIDPSQCCIRAVAMYLDKRPIHGK